MDACMNAMVQYFKGSIPSENISVLKGVEGLLPELQQRNALLGLVTGNLEPIAWEKLGKVGIDHYFKVGGFGSDAINRTELVRIAIRRAETAGFRGDNIFLFGDTVHDVKAGNHAGVEAIGVATGIYSREELIHAGAKMVFDDLTDSTRLVELLTL
jgi:phosphoglycolate phosphatase-like HAD superfamily hydrolase